MKIEFQCKNCNSTLRLPKEYEGRKARCPVCNNVDVVTASIGQNNNPGSQEGTRSPETTVYPFSGTLGSKDFASGPTRPSPIENPYDQGSSYSPNDFSTPPQEHNPYASPYINPSPVASNNDGNSIAGLILGIISIACVPLGCCFIISGLGFLIGGVGLTLSFYSRSPNRVTGIVLNSIGLVLCALILAVIMIVAFADSF